MDGAQSDLRTGLPWQMVEIHEPVRLQFTVLYKRTGQPVKAAAVQSVTEIDQWMAAVAARAMTLALPDRPPRGRAGQGDHGRGRVERPPAEARIAESDRDTGWFSAEQRAAWDLSALRVVMLMIPPASTSP